MSRAEKKRRWRRSPRPSRCRVSYAVQHDELHLLEHLAPVEYLDLARDVRNAYLHGVAVTDDRRLLSLPLPAAGEAFDAA